MGIISNLTRRTEKFKRPVGMVDIHCHILPGIDDGSASMKESIAMAELAVSDGISEIIATPHLNMRLYDFSRVAILVRSFNEVLAEKQIPLIVHQGAEVSVIFVPEQLSGFSLNNGSWLLLEFCHTRLPSNAAELLKRFIDAGYKVIIAHPERNPSIIQQPELLSSLLQKNVFVQVTSGSLTGVFGLEVQCCALYLLRKHLIDFIASDAHSMTKRQPLLFKAFRVAEKYIGYTDAERLVCGNPRKVLGNEYLVS